MVKGAPLLPEVADDSGYRLTDRDLMFLQISDVAFRACVAARLPLGFSSINYLCFST
jgi:hypothetical protein